jgi:phage protein D
MLLPREVLLEPYYEIHINGVKLEDDLKKYITQVEVEESDNEADLGRITVADKDFIFSNNLELVKKTPIKIFMGHKKKFRLMLDGEITHIEADFGEDGVPYITIGAIDKTNKMTYEKKSRVFKNKTVSDVVKIIAREYGFKPKVQDTEPIIDQITQDNETDAQFLAKLADDEAFKFYIITQTNELYFGDRISNATVKDTINYNSGDSTIISFRPQLIEKNKEEEVKTSNSNISDTTGKTVTTKTSTSSGKPPKQSNSSSKPKSNSKAGISTVNGAVMLPR